MQEYEQCLRTVGCGSVEGACNFGVGLEKEIVSLELRGEGEQVEEGVGNPGGRQYFEERGLDQLFVVIHSIEIMYDFKAQEFHRQLTLNAYKVDLPHLHKLVKALKQFIFVRPNFKNIIPAQHGSKLILIRSLPEVQPEQVKSVESVNVRLDISNYSYKEVCQQVLKEWGAQQVAVPMGFQTVGSLAHFNLQPSQVPFKKLFGEVLLSKSKHLRTVVNKTQKLHNVYRTPVLDLMAGQPDYRVSLRQNNTLFTFDFQKVYWCSRLQTERDRILNKYMKPGQLLLDLFCGVGPLAVRAAVKGLFVVANDLNPDSYPFLQKNCKDNGVQNRMLLLNKCAREVIRSWLDQKEIEQVSVKFRDFDHVYMNLPVDAVEFLGEFRSYRKKARWLQMQPLFHVTCFVRGQFQSGEGPRDDQYFRKAILKRLQTQIPELTWGDIIQMHHIKNVTVTMRMYCVTLRISCENHQQQI